MSNNLIKQDGNFLEYPLYILNEKNVKQDIEMILDDKKYKLTVGYQTPNSTDMLFLYYFMKSLQKQNYERKIILKKSQIIKEIAPNNATYYHKRLVETLKVWRNVGMTFEGTFYDGDNYKTMVFGVLDDGKIEGNGCVHINFNETFIEILKNTNFYRYIDFEKFKSLRKPISRRMYEILKKNKLFLKIGIKKLAEKLILRKKYPSQILQKLKPAINEINKNTDLEIDFSTYKNDDGETICIFKNKENNAQTKQMDFNFKSESKAHKFVLYKKARDKNILKIINEFTGDQDVLISGIKYANKKAKDNYASYLKQTLDNDWGKEIREKENALKEQYEDLINASLKQTFELTKSNEEECKELIFESMMDMKNRASNETYLKPEYIYPIIEDMWKRKHYSRTIDYEDFKDDE